MEFKQLVADQFRNKQLKICQGLETLDGVGKFEEHLWEREGGGGGHTRIIAGKTIEKGGVNFSAVHGNMPGNIASKLEMNGGEFFATGVSIVLHPSNPFVPIIHMNIRYFETQDNWWFGGGIDLTPHYVFPEYASKFHQKLKDTCDKYSNDFYPKFKKWADEYFNIKHRNESRGIGGIFYDRLNQSSSNLSKEDLLEFSLAVGDTFLPAYIEQVNAFRDYDFNETNMDWMRVRRGRYVEFNLIWDRGTKFGLETSGRTESILMSLPPLAAWEYDYNPEPSSPEGETLNWLKNQRVDWI